MRKKNLLTVCIIIFLVLFFYSNFYTTTAIKGVYVNQNYNQKGFLNNIPYKADTLKLYDNNIFSSAYYGKGTYEIYHTIKGTRITLNYGAGIDEESFDTSIERAFFIGNFKINLFSDLNQYYEKIE